MRKNHPQNDQNQTGWHGYAECTGVNITFEGDKVVSTSKHYFSATNHSQRKINFEVGYIHILERWTGVNWIEEIRDDDDRGSGGILEVDPGGTVTHTIVSPAKGWVHDKENKKVAPTGDEYKLGCYTYVRGNGHEVRADENATSDG